MAAPARSHHRSAYPNVDNALKRFEAYVQQLPEVSLLPQSPNACAPIDTQLFINVKEALGQLPKCTAPQFVNAELRRQIESFQERYSKCLSLFEKKGVISTAARQALMKNIVGQQVDNQHSNSAQDARKSVSGVGAATGPEVGAAGSGVTAGSVAGAGSNGFFAFNQNKQVSLGKQPEDRSVSFLTRVFGKRMPA